MTQSMHKAVFLDRDGVVNKEIGKYISSVDLFEMPDYVAVQLKRLADAGYLLVVITNQGGIAKGLYSQDDLAAIHKKMNDMLESRHVTLTDIYYCPHYPDFGKCLCRKPGSLLIEKALARFNIDARQSFMIGDKDRDVEAAEAAGVNGIMVDSNQDWTFVVDGILKQNIH